MMERLILGTALAISSTLTWRLAAAFIEMDRNTPDPIAAWTNLLFVAALSTSFLLFMILISSFCPPFNSRFVPILGATLGVVPNCCYWSYITMAHYDWRPPFIYKLIGITGALLGAPGGHIALLWDPNFTLFHTHLKNATLVSNWIIVTSLNVILWSVVVIVIAHSINIIRCRMRKSERSHK